MLLSIGAVGRHATAGESLERITRTGRIVLGARDGSLPFSYVAGHGKPVGYTMDICTKLVEAIRKHVNRPELQVTYLQVTPSTRFTSIVEGKSDLDCGPNTNTFERRQRVAFTIPNFIATSRMLVHANAGIRNWSDLRGKLVVTTAGTTNARSIMERNSTRALKIRLTEASDDHQSFRQVEERKADAFAMDDVLLFALRAASGRPETYAIVGDPLTVEPYAIMFSKQDAELKKVVDGEMARIILSGEINTLYAKWFNSPIPPDGINLNMPIGSLLRSSFQFPSDKVGDDW
ncbi:MAG TPA: amino acid ABC transporter substrate-binding protein [Noviherbaspirillum sp.]|nr:amino acid ABC transporter substrate-binding protein [Noviherbaspirillum sp.]